MDPPSLLLVDHDENDVLFMKAALARGQLANGCHVVRDGAAAIDYLGGAAQYRDRACFPLPAVVFLALDLPRVAGMEVLKWIRHQPEMDAIFIIVMTSLDRDADARRAFQEGANFFFIKPFNPLELDEIVQPLKRYWIRPTYREGGVLLRFPSGGLANLDVKAIGRE